ncbi:MAG TPA: IPTL-CTERM sorting domain-containing protein [Myxococcales bacterium]|nr:IPTL-CTERM sorting domain-containing protein [Myxococcales bacterium]
MRPATGLLSPAPDLTHRALIGTGEAHGVIQLTGTFSSVTWTSLTAENWNGFSIAFENLANPPPVPALGAWGLLIMSVLLGSVGIIVVRSMN